MKKLVCVLLFVLCPFIVFSNTTENIIITGTVNQHLNLTPQSNTIQLTITGDGSEAVGTDTITAVSNIKLWKVVVTSLNNSYLVQDTLQIPYKIKIDCIDAATNSFSDFVKKRKLIFVQLITDKETEHRVNNAQTSEVVVPIGFEWDADSGID